ncbi:hypothetical protein HLRTI_002011 [Halorhabdus tiamatea SARL4B]|uniref:Uncharacterized protein n=1 Tax=Halorhabdus tiamatea SARL4B TaxID=1033806 RepID=F7PKK0_9EURY|nr:hypothetical protein [Halorhabdus tiamatea]ERJ05983.1 hypothetical protein HLRTI_002011 [Halorhabdus tiamatea SARL4B]CCQ33985.1 hypothetical protein HTIA_1865 [Halorhabdus tiamatea SARL4B]
MTDDNPLADARVRRLIGLSGAAVLAAVAILFLEGSLRWIVLGVAALDAIVTPYILKQAVENDDESEEEVDEYGFSR